MTVASFPGGLNALLVEHQTTRSSWPSVRLQRPLARPHSRLPLLFSIRQPHNDRAGESFRCGRDDLAAGFVFRGQLEADRALTLVQRLWGRRLSHYGRVRVAVDALERTQVIGRFCVRTRV